MALHYSTGRWQLGLSLSLLTAFLWGILPIALKVALQTLDVYTLTWFRFLLAFGLLSAYLSYRGQLPALSKLTPHTWLLLGIAIAFLAINYILFLQGLDQTSAANAQVLIQLAPAFLGLGGILVFRERYTRRQWIGVGLLTLGMTLFFHEQLQSLVTNAGAYLMGSSLLVIAAIAWAIYALAQKQLLLYLSSAQIMCLLYGGCLVVFTPTASPQQLLAVETPWQWGVLLFCGLNTLVAYGAFAEAINHWEASRVSAILAVTPLVTLSSIGVLQWFSLSLIGPNSVTPLGFLGAGAVVVGSWLTALGQSSKSAILPEPPLE